MLQNLASFAGRHQYDIRHVGKMSEELSEKEHTILELLTVQPQMTAVMLASVLGVTSAPRDVISVLCKQR